MMPTDSSPIAAVPKVRRVRIYTRLSPGLRKNLLAYCKGVGRSERAVIEDAVARYLANPGRDSSTSGPVNRLAKAIDDDRRLRERQHRDFELVSAMLGQFMRLWLSVHAPTFNKPATPKAGDELYLGFAAKVADKYRSGHRFVHDLPGFEAGPSRRDGKP